LSFGEQSPTFRTSLSKRRDLLAQQHCIKSQKTFIPCSTATENLKSRPEELRMFSWKPSRCVTKQTTLLMSTTIQVYLICALQRKLHISDLQQGVPYILFRCYLPIVDLCTDMPDAGLRKRRNV